MGVDVDAVGSVAAVAVVVVVTVVAVVVESAFVSALAGTAIAPALSAIASL